jgi:hypothetical protein
MSLVSAGVRRAGIAVVSCLALSSPCVASASQPLETPQVRSARDIAGPSPYVGRHCNVATPFYTQPGGKEAEPTVAVDPRHPRHRITAWMDATRATVDVKYSDNGGRSWHASVPPKLDRCTGDRSQSWEASGDVWLSIGADGIAYMTTLSWAHFVTPPASGYVSVVHVQTSRDGGRTWSAPVFLDGHHSVSDKPMVSADPHRRGVAYVIWRNASFGMPVGARGATELLFSRTRDGGRTWTSPVKIDTAGVSDFFGTPEVSTLRNGTLVATSSLANPSGGTNLLAYRSTDRGNTWSKPTLIRTVADGDLPAVCGQNVSGGDTGAAAGQQTVVHGKTVTFVTLDGAAAAAGHGAIIQYMSSDAGRSWRHRTIVKRNEPIIMPSTTSGPRRRLGLVWDEINTPAANCSTQTIPSRTRFASSRDGGARWGHPVTVGARGWNLASGARGTGGFSGYFIGDYQSLAAIPRGFTTATVQGRPLDRTGHTPRVTGDTGVVVANIRR